MKFAVPDLVSHPRPPRIILLPPLGSLGAPEAKAMLADLFEADCYSPLGRALTTSTGTETISDASKKVCFTVYPTDRQTQPVLLFFLRPHFVSVFPFPQGVPPSLSSRTIPTHAA